MNAKVCISFCLVCDLCSLYTAKCALAVGSCHHHFTALLFQPGGKLLCHFQSQLVFCHFGDYTFCTGSIFCLFLTGSRSQWFIATGHHTGVSRIQNYHRSPDAVFIYFSALNRSIYSHFTTFSGKVAVVISYKLPAGTHGTFGAKIIVITIYLLKTGKLLAIFITITFAASFFPGKTGVIRTGNCSCTTFLYILFRCNLDFPRRILSCTLRFPAGVWLRSLNFPYLGNSFCQAFHPWTGESQHSGQQKSRQCSCKSLFLPDPSHILPPINFTKCQRQRIFAHSYCFS